MNSNSRSTPHKDYAERRGITFRTRVAQIMRRLMPECVRDAVDDMLDRLRAPGDGVPGPEAGTGREREGSVRSKYPPAEPGALVESRSKRRFAALRGRNLFAA